MSITDEDLAKQMFITFQAETEYLMRWEELGEIAQHLYIAYARTARRMLCPPSPEELRIERGKVLLNTLLDAGILALSWYGRPLEEQEALCNAADAVLAKKAEQDREVTP